MFHIVGFGAPCFGMLSYRMLWEALAPRQASSDSRAAPRPRACNYQPDMQHCLAPSRNKSGQSTKWAFDYMWHAQVRGTQNVELEFSDIKLAGQVCCQLLLI